MNTTLEQDTTAYDENSPKLQWLILLIPALGAFVAYSLIRMHKRKKAQQLLLAQESQHLPRHHPITVPYPAFFRQRLYLAEQDQRERRRQRRLQQHDAPPPPPAYSPSSSTLPKYDEITEPT
ncbi:hypothetical protein V8B55DRAFT_1437161 [Mucor lusitanicus]|uniref:Uncharacterized protein n=2 Tax=Mucor circinelloides f. lusitanicus TaxID=29924 RepID=A0A162T987_MUCCL|nr:hypothetical protein FB192DRAFT_1462431 [Mucor lusitanicus]OAD02842.1 hypothetical protein MUCCIDRAFT_109688 [Mucor lusitanicus CBS 277.49]